MKHPQSHRFTRNDFLSSGSILLNINSSGYVSGAIPKGYYVLLVGDSSSGKTFLTHTILAEASINPEFQKYEIIFDPAEDGALMNVAAFFGTQLAERIKDPPFGISRTPTDFYKNVRSLQRKKKKFIYILDSMDALDEADIEDEEKRIEEGQKLKGSYGVGKAKENSRKLRRITAALKESGSILIIISQTRQNIGFGSQFEPKTRSGGDALRFFARLEYWTSVKQSIKKRINGKDRKIGIVTKIQIKKNHVTGQMGTVLLPILYKTGIDDIGSCIDFLVEEKHWKVKKKIISATEFYQELDREELADYIYRTKKEHVLSMIVFSTWKKIEKQMISNRPNKYVKD